MRHFSLTNPRKSSGKCKHWILPLAIGTLLLGATSPSIADSDRSGKEVVQATCSACHTTGKDGAPKIGDKTAWAKRTKQGLTGLTQNALDGIRKMPAHGGSADTNELELNRAITYMVNQSGGKWTEPVGKVAPVAKAAPPVERTGQHIVQVQCGKCHQTGESGAPKVGDRDAWVQRLKRGLDDVVRSALHGHGPMPARGGMADITVNEMRNAIIYMFNPASATMVPAIATPVAPPDPFHKVVGNTEIFFGVVSAESIRASQKSGGAAAMADIPSGADNYYVSVTLRDRLSGAIVTNAQVDARVEDPALRSESRTLDLIAINKGISFGGYFQLPTKGQYYFNVKIQRPDPPASGETRFSFTRY